MDPLMSTPTADTNYPRFSLSCIPTLYFMHIRLKVSELKVSELKENE